MVATNRIINFNTVFSTNVVSYVRTFTKSNQTYLLTKVVTYSKYTVISR